MNIREELKNLYEDSYRNYLDGESTVQDGLVHIGDSSYEFTLPPNEILSELDPDMYDGGLERYIALKLEELNHSIISKFPAPIAYYYSRATENFENANQRVQFLRTTWESIIYFIFSLCISDLVRREKNIEHIRLFNNQRVKKDHNGTLTSKLGWKLEFISKLIEDDDNEIGDWLSADAVDILKELNQNRNVIQHGVAMEESVANNTFNDIFPKVQLLFTKLKFLERVELLIYEGTGDTITKLEFKGFNGHSLRPSRKERTVSLEDIARFNSFLYRDNVFCELHGNLIPVSPYYLIKREGSGNKRKIWFFKQLNRRPSSEERATLYFEYEGVDTEERVIELDGSTFQGNINDLLITSVDE